MDFEKIKDMPPEELADLIFEEELPKCPFCGGEPTCDEIPEEKIPIQFLPVVPRGDVRCTVCGAKTLGKTLQEAKEKWKRRVSNEK